LYRQWARKLDIVMRQEHLAGEKTFVDHAGQTVPVTDPKTGEVRHAYVFVAVLGASSYAYAEATWSRDLWDWIGSHTRAFEYFGGTSTLVVPDNWRSGVKPTRVPRSGFGRNRLLTSRPEAETCNGSLAEPAISTRTDPPVTISGRPESARRASLSVADALAEASIKPQKASGSVFTVAKLSHREGPDQNAAWILPPWRLPPPPPVRRAGSVSRGAVLRSFCGHSYR
jgi:hypothetical protein